MNNLLTKYNSLRQQPWTHILAPFSHLYGLFLIWTIGMMWKIGPAADLVPLITYCLGLICMVFGFILAGITALINHFLKKKVTNHFFTKNKLYGCFWHFGNFYLLAFFLVNLRLFLWIVFGITDRFLQ